MLQRTLLTREFNNASEANVNNLLVERERKREREADKGEGGGGSDCYRSRGKAGKAEQ